MKKRLLVDLSYLKDIYRGYGQIALNYGYYFKNNYKRDTSPYELILLVPRKYFGAFGNEVKYISSTNLIRKHCKYALPAVDIWHNLQYPSRFIPWNKKTTYIFTLHDLNCLNPQYDTIKKRLKKNYRMITKNVNRAQVLVTVSNYAKQQILDEFDVSGKEFKMIYNGVEKLTDKTFSKPRRDIKEPFFFYISAYREQKNFHPLLDLMKLMPEKTLYLAGNDKTSYGTFIKKRIKDENITNVHTLGKISEEEKRWMYAHCEALFFPSEFEGFGLPVIEAMQFGKPVFSSNKTSLAEIGNKYAYFWNNSDAVHMKKVIEDNLDEFYKNPQLAEDEKAYANTYSYEKHFQEYEKIYREII